MCSPALQYLIQANQPQEATPLRPRLNLAAVLAANQDKDFVKRILYKDAYPAIQNPDGSYSTHLMGYATAGNGNAAVFPSITTNPNTGALENNSGPNAPRVARERGDYILLPEDQAKQFAEGAYKAFFNAGPLPVTSGT